MTETVHGLDAARFAVADADVVDDGVIAAEGVGLLRHLAHPGDALHVADHDMLGARQRLTGVVATLLVAGVQGDGVAVVDEQPRGHQAEPVARTGDQYPCHPASFMGYRRSSAWWVRPGLPGSGPLHVAS